MGGSGFRVGNVLVTALAFATWGGTYVVATEMLPTERPLLAAVRALPVGRLPASAISFSSVMGFVVSAGVLGFLVLGRAYMASQAAGAASMFAAVVIGRISGGDDEGTRVSSEADPVDAPGPVGARESGTERPAESGTEARRPRPVRPVENERDSGTMIWSGHPDHGSRSLVWGGYRRSRAGRLR